MLNGVAGTWRGISAVRRGLALTLVMVSALTMAAAPASADSVVARTPGLRLNGIGCSHGSVLNCVAVGGSFGGGSADEFIPLKNGVAAPPQRIPSGFNGIGVGCSSATTCVVVGSVPAPQDMSEGAFVSVTDGVPGAIQSVPGTEALYGIDCQSAVCLAVGQGAFTFSGGQAPAVVVPITDGAAGSAEPVTGATVLNGISCRSAGDCAAVGVKAVGVNGTVYSQAVTVTVTNGSPGSPQTVPNTAQNSILSSVACPAGASGCVAVGVSYTNPNGPGAGMIVPISGGVPSSPRPAPGINSLTTVVCSSATNCVAGGDRTGGAGGATTGVTAPVTIDGLPGPAQDHVATEQVKTLACADASHCVYTGSTGYTASGGGTGLILSVGDAAEPSAGAALSGSLKASGPAASISAILRNGGFPAAVTAPAAGSVTITWYYLPAGARLARAVRPVVVARGSKIFAAPGQAKLKLRLTAQGRKLLKHAKRVKLTAVGAFVPKHGKKASQRKSITLR